MHDMLVVNRLFGIFGQLLNTSVQVTVYLLYLSASFLAIQAAQAESAAQRLITIPVQADWIDCGLIFAAGTEGEWDTYLWGGFANGVIKKNGTYYLYYQGASGYDENVDTVTWRSIGVATSKDGINFTKYEHNPVITWSPNDHPVEGAASSGVFLDENNDVVIYYGANTSVTGNQVNADGRLAISPDGFNFTDLGVVLEQSDRSVWGAGDQLYPIIGLQDAGRWFTYYIPDGTPQRGQLGVAWGNSRDALTNSSATKEGSNTIPVWGLGSSIRLEEDVYALFLNNLLDPDGPVTEVRTVSLDAPDSLSTVVQRYQFDNVRQGIYFFDQERNIWFMYYRSFEGGDYGVKVVPADGQAAACASTPVPPGTNTPISPPTSTPTSMPVPSDNAPTPTTTPVPSSGNTSTPTNTPMSASTPMGTVTGIPTGIPTLEPAGTPEARNRIFLPNVSS